MTDAVVALAPVSGMTAAICAAVGVSRATVERRRSRLAAPPAIARPRPAPARTLTAPQQKVVLDLLHAPRFADQAPAEIYATLLDEGVYHCSIRTMYRILEQNGEVRERRQQLRHPVYQKPELLAEKPNEVWSWDITKLMGPSKWSYFYLYVILDIFSRRVVGWCVADAESATLFQPLFDDAIEKHNVPPGQLTLHADRGGPMKAKATAFLLADLGVTRSHNRPHTSNDNPFSERLQDAEVSAALSQTLRLYRGRQSLLPCLLRLVQPRPPPLRDRPDDAGPGALRPDRRRACGPPAHPQPGVRCKPRALRQKAARSAQQTYRHMDQSADTEKARLNAEPGSFEVIEPFSCLPPSWHRNRHRQSPPPCAQWAAPLHSVT